MLKTHVSPSCVILYGPPSRMYKASHGLLVYVHPYLVSVFSSASAHHNGSHVQDGASSIPAGLMVLTPEHLVVRVYLSWRRKSQGRSAHEACP
jgi:hypothetical protein